MFFIYTAPDFTSTDGTFLFQWYAMAYPDSVRLAGLRVDVILNARLWLTVRGDIVSEYIAPDFIVLLYHRQRFGF